MGFHTCTKRGKRITSNFLCRYEGHLIPVLDQTDEGIFAWNEGTLIRTQTFVLRCDLLGSARGELPKCNLLQSVPCYDKMCGCHSLVPMFHTFLFGTSFELCQRKSLLWGACLSRLDSQLRRTERRLCGFPKSICANIMTPEAY